MTLDDIVQKEADTVSLDVIESNSPFIDSYDAEKYHNSKKSDKRILLKEYRQQCAEYLTNELNWPEKFSKNLAGKLHVPRERKTWTDWLIGYTIGSLPDRFLEPVSRITHTDKMFYTKVNILADIVFLGASAFLIYEMNIQHQSEIMNNIYHWLHGGGPKFLIYANEITRGLQIPYRYYQYRRGKHTWSLATIINPDIPEAIIASGFVLYDQIQKHPKLKTALKKGETYVVDKYKEIKQAYNTLRNKHLQ